MIDRILKKVGLQRIHVGNYSLNVRPDVAYAQANKQISRILAQQAGGIR